jgi:hypothetical protein
MKKTIIGALLLLVSAPLAVASFISTSGSGGTGILTLNTLTADPQSFATGTTGNDFNISSASDTHTFNLPNASATARGVVSTGAQTFAGAKTFSDGVVAAVTGNASTATALAANPSDCAAGQYATAIAASGNLTCADPISGVVETISGHLEAPTAKPFILEQYAQYAYTINSIVSQCDSGTADFDLEINGTNVTGCASQQMASSEATDNCTAANTVAVGDTVSLNVTGVSSPDDCRFTVKITR